MFRVFSTDLTARRERFDYWYEETKRIGGFRFAASDLSGGDFHATIDANAMGDAALLSQSASAYGIERTSRDNAHLREATFLLVSHRAGVVHYECDSSVVTARPGDMVLTDLTRPLKSTIEPGGLVSFSVVLPHSALAETTTAATVKLGGSGRVTELIDGYMRSLEAMPAQTIATHGAMFAGHIRDLVLCALRDGPADESAQPALGAARMTKAMKLIEARLGDPELSPADVAASLGISVRYLHLLFEETGVTFSRHVIERRLALAHDELSDPNRAGRTIADIALRWGFNSFSHFTRRFRARYGLAPSELRRQRR